MQKIKEAGCCFGNIFRDREGHVNLAKILTTFLLCIAQPFLLLSKFGFEFKLSEIVNTAQCIVVCLPSICGMFLYLCEVLRENKITAIIGNKEYSIVAIKKEDKK